MKTNQLRAMMLTVMLVITTLGGTVRSREHPVELLRTYKGSTGLKQTRGKLLSSAILVLRKWKKSYSLQRWT